jgi:hypothetical protein
MADYFTPTVLQPVIPDTDMTPLERLILTSVFQSEPDGDGLYFFAEIALNETPAFEASALSAALSVSADIDSHAAVFVRKRLAAAAGLNMVELDLTSDLAWETIMQDIVRRSATIEHVIATSAFTCSKMAPDGFGGMVVLITADAVLGKSTEDMLCDLMDQAEHGDLGVAADQGAHVLLRLDQQAVRAAIAEVLIADTSYAPMTPDEVTDADVREACLAVASRIDLTEIKNQAEFDAALAALNSARDRRKKP